jgi:hypothetical protein
MTCDLGHLEADVAAMAEDLGTDLDQLLAQAALVVTSVLAAPPSLPAAASPNSPSFLLSPDQSAHKMQHSLRKGLRFFAEVAAKKWPLRGSLKPAVGCL